MQVLHTAVVLQPQVMSFVVEQSKKAGNQAFKEKRYQEAIKMYCQVRSLPANAVCSYCLLLMPPLPCEMKRAQVYREAV